MRESYTDPDDQSFDVYEGQWPTCPDCGHSLNGVSIPASGHDIEFVGLGCPMGCLPIYATCDGGHSKAQIFECAACVMEAQVKDEHGNEIAKLRDWEDLAKKSKGVA